MNSSPARLLLLPKGCFAVMTLLVERRVLKNVAKHSIPIPAFLSRGAKGKKRCSSSFPFVGPPSNNHCCHHRRRRRKRRKRRHDLLELIEMPGMAALIATTYRDFQSRTSFFSKLRFLETYLPNARSGWEKIVWHYLPLSFLRRPITMLSSSSASKAPKPSGDAATRRHQIILSLLSREEEDLLLEKPSLPLGKRRSLNTWRENAEGN